MSYQSSHTGINIDKGINLALAMYPVGSIYLSVNNINPGTIFGGTWEQIQDRFLLAAGSTYAGGATGGAASHTHTSAAHTHTTAGHTLTVNEIPSHTHFMTLNNYDQNNYMGGFKWEYAASGYHKSNGSNYIGAEGGGASHSHGNTGSTTPGNTGSSSSLPPYLAIYVWKRTA